MVLRALRRLPVTRKDDNKEIIEFINRELVPFLNELSAPSLSNEILVLQQSDIGVVVNGKVKTLPGKIYRFDLEVDIDDDVYIETSPDNIFLGYGRERCVIRGNVDGALVRISENAGNFEIKDVSIENAKFDTGDGIEMLDGNLSRFFMDNSAITVNGGRTVNGGAATVSIREGRMIGFGPGLTPNAGGSTFIVDGMLMQQSVGGSGNGCIDLGTNQWSAVIRISNVSMITAPGGFSFKGLPSNGNLSNINARLTINDSRLVGPGTPLSGVTVDDLQVVARSNRGILNSAMIGGMYFEGNATVTTFSDSINFFPILGTTIALDNRRMELTGDNEITITDLDPESYLINVTLSATKSGATINYGFGVFRERDTIITQIIPTMFAEVRNTIVAIPLQVEDVLETGDKISIRVINPTNTNSLTVDTLIVTIKGG